MNATSLRRALYPLLRAAFRSIPFSDGQRDRLRNWFLDRYATDWAPAPKLGKLREKIDVPLPSNRLFTRADERAIGYIQYRKGGLPSPMPATLVAFYLPQFHTFAENDAWWGKGFTEWRNVTRALPQFEGHIQPRLPGDLGFYDLRNPQIMRDQALLAADYGIGAFCFYFYWFNGKPLMEEVLRQWLADDSITLPFCICWANENWARRWDGRGNDILISQKHSAEDDLAFIAHVAAYLRDPRALKVDGKPLMLIYRPNLLPDASATSARWRQWCRDHDIGEIHLAYVQGFERPDPREIGFDAAVEFPPNMSTPPSLSSQQWLINPEFRGDVLDWRKLAAEIAARPLPNYTLYPGVNPGWDNEARRSGAGRVYLHASPRGYRDWLRKTIHERLATTDLQKRLVFINAWNEWAEGAVLEPDARLGHAWLEATRQALHPGSRPPAPRRPCLVIHAWYPDVLAEMLTAVNKTKLDWRVIITTDPSHQDQVDNICNLSGLATETHVFPNHGRDILPFLCVAEMLLQQGEDIVLKLHTKRSIHRVDGETWRRELIDRLLCPDRAENIFRAFTENPALGLVAPEGHIQPIDFYWGDNEKNVRALLTRFGVAQPSLDTDTFIAGSMFWVRLEALRPMLDSHLYASQFDREDAQVDGTLAHAIERTFSLVARHAGYQQYDAASLLGMSPAQVSTPYPYARRS